MPFDGESPIYLGKLHPSDQTLLDKLTESKTWDYEQFRQIVVALATFDQYFPAHNRPERFNFQGLRPSIEELRHMTEESKREHARVVFADIDRKTLVVSGRTTVGSSHRARLDVKPQLGREGFQRRSLSVHVHPLGIGGSVLGTELGLSDQDYVSFLSDREQIGMFMAWGENILIALKTTATPNNLPMGSVERQIAEVKRDYLEADTTRSPFLRVIAFNRAVCSEFGLVLYLSDKESKDFAKRVNVTI